MSTMKRNTVLTAAIAVALAGGVAQAAPQNLSQGTGFTIDNIGITSGNGLTAGFNAATAGAAAATDNPYAGGTVSNNIGSDAANGFLMNTVTDANGNKYIRTIVLQDTTSGETANFAYEADISSFRATDALNATTTSPDGNGGNNGGIAAKMIIDEASTAFKMNASIQNGGFTGNADSTAVDYGKTNVVVNQELTPTGQGGNDGAQLFAMNILTNGTAAWTDGSMTILQKGDGAENADFGHTVLAGTYLTAANLGTLTIAHNGSDAVANAVPPDTLNTASYGAVTATWIHASVPTGVSAYNDFSLNPTDNTAGFGLLVYRGYTSNNVATSGLGSGVNSANPVFGQADAGVGNEIRGFTLSADGGLYNGNVSTPADLNTAYNTPVAPATGTISSQFTPLGGVANPF